MLLVPEMTSYGVEIITITCSCCFLMLASDSIRAEVKLLAAMKDKWFS